MAALFLPLLLGTVRRDRRSGWVADAAEACLRRRPDVETTLIDPRDLPFGDLEAREWEMEPRPPAVARLVDQMARADGFLIVTPEYNHGYPGALKNLLDVMYDEWNHKPFGIVGVGGVSGGIRAIEQLRGVVGGLGAIPIPTSVPVPFISKTWTEEGPDDADAWAKRFDKLVDELAWYARALRDARRAHPPES